MKKFLTSLVATVTAISAAAFTACSQSDKIDISKAKTLADLEGAKITAQSGTFHETARSQIKNVQGQLYDSFDDMYIALTSGAVDGYIAEEPTALSVCYKNKDLDYLHLVNNDTGFTASDEDTAIAIGSKKGSGWTEKINPVLAQISLQNRMTLMEQIVKANADETIEAFAVSNTAPETTTGTLKVAMECEYAPFNWTQRTDANGAVPISSEGAENLYANGYDVQIAKYVANALGLQLEIYAAEWDSLITGVEAGTYDLIIAGMSPTAERREVIDFTDIYYSSNLVVIYKK
ncbi:MAG: transporter substrate-binding domain-containing protein [Candidatus Scatosoma sp.]